MLSAMTSVSSKLWEQHFWLEGTPAGSLACCMMVWCSATISLHLGESRARQCALLARPGVMHIWQTICTVCP